MKIKPQSGLTLAELMITISIFGLLMVVSIPAFVKRNEAQKLQVAADLISNKLLIARQKAVATKMRYRIEFNYSARQFRILRETSPGTWELDPPNNLFELPVGILVSPTSTPTDGIIEIEPRGTVSQADLPAQVRIKDKDNHLKSVQISRAGMIQETSAW